ncbi:MAG: zinc ribbon domain-containing protein [Acidobacteriota bacterium]
MNDLSRWTLCGALPCLVIGLLFIGLLGAAAFGWVGAEGHGLYSWGLLGPIRAPWVLPGLWLLGLCALIQVSLAVWVGLDANRRGMNGLLWGALVLFTCVVGLVVYLIVTRGAPSPAATAATAPGFGGELQPATCRRCGAAVQPQFRVCPFCSAPLGARCPKCSQSIASGWKVCPNCAQPLGASETPA